MSRKPCAVDGCFADAVARRLCRTHYRRYLATGDARPDVPIRVTVGTGFTSHGYRYVPVPRSLRSLTGGETPYAEHRLVLAQILGRALRADESVHNKNGNRLDNRPENLELWSRWQPSGQRVEDRVAGAVNVLLRYAPYLLLRHPRRRRFRCDGQLSIDYRT
jgi:HNH endonuclease